MGRAMDVNIEEDDEESMQDDDEDNGDDIVEPADTAGGRNAGTLVYLPGSRELDEGEELVCDKTAYVMYHQAHTGAPCLSFDVLPDGLGDNRESFPMTCYIVCGTQAERSHANHVIVMKMSALQRTKHKEQPSEADEEGDESESDDETEQPTLDAAMIKHPGSVNRLRATVLGGRNVAATWSERGTVYVWDLTMPLNAVNDSAIMAQYKGHESTTDVPLCSFSGHQVEGFAIDWSPTTPGQLLTGDCNKNIHLWTPHEGSWTIDQRPFVGHTASVEDVQWSPNEKTVFASCSVDRSLRIWDTRAAPSKACMITCEDAHSRDVNCIHWNSNDPFLVSGGDDGIIRIWDLRQFKAGKAVATFKHHTAPLTSVEWHPTDSTVFAASGSDDQITIWDLAVERDTDAAAAGDEEPADVPPQLLFIHQGQTDIKELHWHAQLPGVLISTAHTGLDIFRTISV